MSQLSNILAKRIPVYSEAYGVMENYFTDIALGLLNDIRSDHMALIVLDCASDLEPKTELPLNCLQIAIRGGNGKCTLSTFITLSSSAQFDCVICAQSCKTSECSRYWMQCMSFYFKSK